MDNTFAGKRQAAVSEEQTIKQGKVSSLAAIRRKPWLNALFSILVPLVTTILLEWVARGTLGPNKQGNGFFQAIVRYYPSFIISVLLLLAVYVFISQLTGLHPLATFVVGLIGLAPAIITHYKLTLRGEPFLPWDLTQVEDLMNVSDKLEFDVPANIYISIAILLLLFGLSFFVKVPQGQTRRNTLILRFSAAGMALVLGLGLLFGIFLSPAGTAAVGIREDMWMQDRYYRTNGVLTGFLTNLQLLNISRPEGYGRNELYAIGEEVQLKSQDDTPLFPASYGGMGNTVQKPDIIYLMAESFWDVTQLEGIEYDQPILPNLTRLANEGAYGKAFSPSFGGGTCDVEFEALTGFSMEQLPAGSKPFQQYVTEDLFSLPQHLKGQGYQTMAIHGYGRRFWNRDTAYPRLGIDEFIASEDFVRPEKKRGFISDNAMVDRIIEEYEAHKDEGPMFIHAVTMQNHTTYNRNRYPADELVNITKSPATIPDSTIGQLEDCATGIRDMDAALGKLADYFKSTGRPAIIVFWGDHMNPMSDGYALFEKTGFIEKDDTSASQLHETPLLMWSNFDSTPIKLGTMATYNLSPVMMDLYGMEKPLMFEYLTQQFPVLRGRSRGHIIQPDNTVTDTMNEEQQAAFHKYSLLQYDYLFGEHYLANDNW